MNSEGVEHGHWRNGQDLPTKTKRSDLKREEEEGPIAFKTRDLSQTED